jgi:drug/metabolite transporter (DMT)-like permease
MSTAQLSPSGASPTMGVAWMIAQTTAMCAAMTAARYLAHEGFDGPQAMFMRGFFGLVWLLPWFLHTLRTEPELLAPPELKLVLLRGLIAAVGVLGWFIALTGMSVSDVVAVQFSHPVYVVIGAALFLREPVGAWRWSAVIIGFVGVLIIIRPGYEAFNPLIIGVLISALSNAIVQLMTKHMALRVSGAVLIFHMNIVMTILAFALSWQSWVWPEWRHMPAVLAVGLFGVLAHIFLARAMRHSDASFLGPIDFLRLPIASAFGWVLFGEYSDLETWIGAGIIFIAVLVITRREALAEKRRNGPQA